MAKELLLEKSASNYSGLFAVIDKYNDGVMDPDKYARVTQHTGFPDGPQERDF